MPILTIITINYNNAVGLKKTIDSVVTQTFQDFEFIIIDGYSSDNSVDIIKNYNRIDYWVSEKDTGIYNAQNKGILKANGSYLLFLNSGDILENIQTLQKIIPSLSKSDVVYGDIITEDVNGLRTHLSSPVKLDVYHFFISTLWHPCTFIRKSLFESVGNYDESFKITADYEFFIRAILRNGATSEYVNMPISVFNLGGISNNPSNDEIQKMERMRSWSINFSPIVIDAFENYTKLLRSGEYKIGKKIIGIKKIFIK